MMVSFIPHFIHIYNWIYHWEEKDLPINFTLEIDLLDNKCITWEDFSNYLISKASSIGGLMGGSKGAGKAMSSIASAGGDDTGGLSSAMGSVEKIKSFSLTMAVNVPPRDKDKHKRESNKGQSA